ncbi:hypothetical protein NQ314_009537 [Rhamnusium bicolor]|uniref:Uncharacterized protein n=1 Tax=Rhamnusium bicolor TaxID=1586634 RepID=A0AAV8Y0H7_9CUCU|nr:hypothetical protein NQ314_009537 [Rhamnusium bicolor]
MITKFRYIFKNDKKAAFTYQCFLKCIFSFKVLLIFSFCYCVCGDEINNLVFKYKYRNVRHCKKPLNSINNNNDELQPFYRKNILENPLYLIFLIFLGILFILMFLGGYK